MHGVPDVFGLYVIGYFLIRSLHSKFSLFKVQYAPNQRLPAYEMLWPK